MIQFLAIAVITGLTYIFFAANLFLPFLIFTRFWWLLLCYVLWWYYDRNTYSNGGRKVPIIQDSKYFDCTREYFPAGLVLAGLVPDPAKNYLFCCHPHGILPFGLLHSVLLGKKNLKELYPFIKIHIATLHTFNFLPLARDFVMALGGISCSEESLTRVLTSSEGGHIVCLMTGGAHDLANGYSGIYKFFIRRRRGFIKIALKTGAPIVPVITFGENEVYHYVADCSHISWLRDICMNWLGCVPPFFYGRGFTENSIGWVPFRKRLTTVVEKAINVEKVENPTDEQIGAVHAKFVDELSELFHKYKFYLENPEDKVLLLE